MCGIDPSPYRPPMIKDIREATTAQEQQQTLRRIARGSVLTCAVLLAVPLLLLGTLIVTYTVERATPEDYPTASRHKTSARIEGNARAAYEAAGFDRSPPRNLSEAATRATPAAWRAWPMNQSTAPTRWPCPGR